MCPKHKCYQNNLCDLYLLQNRIPTKTNPVHRRVLQPNDNMCVEGCGYPETADHIFLGYDIFGSIWYLVRQWLNISSVSSGVIGDHFAQFIYLAGTPQFLHSFLKVIWLACVWVIWKEMNNRVFKTAASDPYALLDKVKLKSLLWLKTNKASFAFYYHDRWHHQLPCMGVFV